MDAAADDMTGPRDLHGRYGDGSGYSGLGAGRGLQCLCAGGERLTAAYVLAAEVITRPGTGGGLDRTKTHNIQLWTDKSII